MKGIFEFEIGGQKRGFKFGTYAFSVACEKEGDIDLNTLFKRCGFPYKAGKDKDGKDIMQADKAKMKTILHLFFGAASHYAEDNDLTIDFKVSTVSNWMDELGETRLMEMIHEAFFQHIPKNLNSQPENRETVLQ